MTVIAHRLTVAQSIAGYFLTWRYGLTEVLVLFTLMYLGWVATGGGLATLDAATLTKVGLGWAAATATLLAVFLVNDAADAEIDRVVHPERAIPQGRSTQHHVYGFGISLLIVAIAMSIAINWGAAVIAVALSAMTVVHYGYAKGRLSIPCSSEVITPLVSALFPLYALAVAGNTDVWIAIYLTGFIYLADLAQDLLGGIHDEEGDRCQNVRTFAIALGARPTLLISLLLFVMALVPAVLLYLHGPVGATYAIVLAGLTGYILYLYVRMFRAPDAALALEAKRANHLAGGYFFVVSASTFLDFVVRSFLH